MSKPLTTAQINRSKDRIVLHFADGTTFTNDWFDFSIGGFKRVPSGYTDKFLTSRTDDGYRMHVRFDDAKRTEGYTPSITFPVPHHLGIPTRIQIIRGKEFSLTQEEARSMYPQVANTLIRYQQGHDLRQFAIWGHPDGFVVSFATNTPDPLITIAADSQKAANQQFVFIGSWSDFHELATAGPYRSKGL